MFAVIQWTTPLMLAGLGLLALPLIAHLMYRRAKQKFVVPTIRFLQQSVLQQNHLLRLKRYLLLLLRCLAVAMLVVAFARPVWHNRSQDAANTDQATAMALVIDASLSTSQSSGNASSFQSFLTTAERSLNQLEPGRDVATIVVAGRSARPVVSQLSQNLPLLKEQLPALNWSYERGDVVGAVTEAARQLATHDGRKMLVIISDLQESNWDDLIGTSAKAIDLPADVEISFVDHTASTQGNIGLSNAKCLPPDPIPGQPIQLIAQITNYSDQIRQIPVSLARNGGESLQQNVRLAANEASIVAFETEYQAGRESTFTFSIPDDLLLADNRAYVAAQPGRKTQIAVISDDPENEPGTTAFFMERALRPFDNDNDRYSVTKLGASSLGPGSLDPFRILIVGYVAAFDEPGRDELVRFVNNGGSLLYLCGEGDVAGQISAIETAAEQDFFPFLLSRLETFDQFDKAPYIQSGKWRSRWFRQFDLQSQVALRQIRFPKAWSVSEIAPDAEVLLTYSNDDPAVATRTFGSGQVVLANLSPSIEFSEFGTYGSFVVLIQMLVGELRGQSESDAKVVGNSLMFAPQSTSPGSDRISIDGPSGNPIASIVAESGESKSLLVDRTTEPGFYRLQNERETLQVIAVNIDPRESDLRQVDSDQIQLLTESLGQSEFNVANSEEFGINLIDKGTPLWGWLALLMLFVLASESFLVGWWKR